MIFHAGVGGGLDYQLCHYGDSKIAFRGPERRLEGDHIAFLGGTETFGRFVPTAFPALLEADLDAPCANFGVVNAGLDLYLNDPTVLALAGQARARVVQVMGAHNMSNRFYQVHPRRNDRFLRASDRLVALFPEVDFTEFHFNRHMLGRLAAVSQARYEAVVTELRTAWVARMKHLLTVLNSPTVMLWFSDHSAPNGQGTDLADHPLFVTRSMLDALRVRVSDTVEVVASEQAKAEGTLGMVFDECDACAAQLALGPRAQNEARQALLPVLQRLTRRDAA